MSQNFLNYPVIYSFSFSIYITYYILLHILYNSVEAGSRLKITVLARSQEISADITAKLKQIIDDMGSDSSKFEEPEHQNCPGTPGYPESRPFKWVNFS